MIPFVDRASSPNANFGDSMTKHSDRMLRKYFLNAIRSFIIASRLIKIDFFFCNYRTSPPRTFFEREMANIIIIIIINIEIALSSSLTGTSIDS